MNWLQISRNERIDLLKAAGVITLAFAFASVRMNLTQFPLMLAVSAITAAPAFLFHELAHKIVAKSYGSWAEFKANNQYLIVTLLSSFLGFIFAAPGAVYHHVSDIENRGKVSMAGPLTNLIIAITFLTSFFFAPVPLLKLISARGFAINAWIGLFNLIPFGNMDGVKILRWNKSVYFALLIALLIFVFGGNLL